MLKVVHWSKEEEEVTRDLGGKNGRDEGQASEIESEKERLERLSLMATISAGLAHDLTPPLAAITLQLRALARQVNLAEELAQNGGNGKLSAAFDACRSSLVSVGEQAEFMRNLLRDFIRISAGKGKGGQRSDVRGAVQAAVRLSRPLLRDHATIEVAAPGDLYSRVDEETIVRTLVHLLLNAGDAFPIVANVGNRIRVTAKPAGDEIQIEVTDNGPGVPPEVVPRLFEPFATSKRRGLGLGLAVGRALLRRAGGDLELVSTGRLGTTFLARLPVSTVD